MHCGYHFSEILFLINDLVLRSMHESSEEEIPMSDVASKVLSALRSLSKN
jgi:hypothetical protein